MIKRFQYILIISFWSVAIFAQQNNGGPGTSGEDKFHPGEQPHVDSLLFTIVHRLSEWKLKDDFTLVDTLSWANDTILDGFHNYDPIFKESFSNIYLSNTGSAYYSNLLSNRDEDEEFIFLNSFRTYFIQPEDIVFYNTTGPYTNLSYKNAPPKSRSEENFSWLFTQNVNKDFNIGFYYKILSSVGSYDASQTDNRQFNIHLTYKAPKYTVSGALIYNKENLYENGGVEDEDDIRNYPTYLDENIFSGAEDVVTNYEDQTEFIENYQLFVTQGFGVGNIKIKKHVTPKDSIADFNPPSDSLFVSSVPPPNSKDNHMPPPPSDMPPPDSLMKAGMPPHGPSPKSVKKSQDEEEEDVLPVATFFHTLNVGTYSRVFKIDNLDDYIDDGDGVIPLYDDAIYEDSLQTRDSTRYTFLNNMFQLKFNEEANSLLRFGLRAYFKNEISFYRYQDSAKIEYDDDEEEYITHYRKSDKVLVNSCVGGQIFKNRGENFWWNAGAKLYFQGYKAGDMEINGEISSLYPVFKDTAGVYAKGKIQLHSASYLQEHYYSNHFIWNNDFNQEKIVQLEAGLRIPTKRFKLSWESKTWTDYLYWNEDAVPDQASQVISAFQITLLKHFKAGAFNSNNSLAYQYSSDQSIYPVPEFTGYSSNYFNFYLAQKVLQVQLGFDVRYHTKYYTPAFMPATGQFYVQNDKKYGDYPYVDLFMNLHLKRARIFIKIDHVNQFIQNQAYKWDNSFNYNSDFFLTKGYPHELTRIKWGVSWNFYN